VPYAIRPSFFTAPRIVFAVFVPIIFRTCAYRAGRIRKRTNINAVSPRSVIRAERSDGVRYRTTPCRNKHFLAHSVNSDVPSCRLSLFCAPVSYRAYNYKTDNRVFAAIPRGTTATPWDARVRSKQIPCILRACTGRRRLMGKIFYTGVGSTSNIVRNFTFFGNFSTGFLIFFCPYTRTIFTRNDKRNGRIYAASDN